MNKFNIKVTKNGFYYSLFLLVLIFFMCNINISYAVDIEAKHLGGIESWIRQYLMIGGAITMVFSLGAFIYNILKLGASSTNVHMREQAIRGLILSGISAAVLPVTLLIYNVLMSLIN